MPASPSPSPSRPLMPMCDTFSSSTHSSPASFAYHNTTQSILARAQESYMLQFSPSARSMAGSYSSSSSAAGPSPRKRGQMDDDNDEVDQNDALSMSKQGLVGMKAYNDDMMDEDGDETMMMEDHGDLPLLSRSVISLSRNGVPPLSFTSSQSGTNSSSSSASSLSSSDLFFTPSSSTIAPSQQGRQMKTMPRRALGKTQSLPVEAFMSQVNTGNQLFVPDVFNATDGF